MSIFKYFKPNIDKKDIISYSAMLTAFMALIVSIYEGYEIRKHNRLSVRPYLQNAVSRNGISNYSIGIKNGGLGPAIIDGFDIYARGKKVEFWNEAMDEIKVNKFSLLTTLRKGDIINSGEQITLVVLDTFANDFQLEYRLRYRSMYDEGFTISYGF